MSLFSDIFGTSGSSSSSQSGTQQQNVNQSQTGTQSNQQTGTQTQTGSQQTSQNTNQSTTSQQSTTGKQTTTTLAPEVQQMLLQLLPSLGQNVSDQSSGPNANVTGLQTLAQLLGDRVVDSNGVDNQVTAAQNVAKRDFELGTGAQIEQTAQAIGGKGNTFAALLQNRGQADLATNLANVDATVRAQARQQDTSDALAAIQALTQAGGAEIAAGNAPIAQLLSVVQALSGATTTTDTEQNTQAMQNLLQQLTGSQNSSTTNITDLLQQLVSSEQSTSQANASQQLGTNQKSNSGGLFGFIKNLF